MIHWLKQKLYYLQIKTLLVLKPDVLFHRINQLDWYSQTLYQWVDDHHFDVGINVLEVGCATGSLSKYLSECTYVPTGIDVSQAMINMAKFCNPSASFHVADIHSLTFKDGEFDAVLSASVINIISDQEKAINEMVRVCKPGGIITILVPSRNFNDDALEGLVNLLGVSNFSEAALKTWHKSAPKMSSDDLEALFKQAGLIPATASSYLQGMLMSVSAIKVNS